jgi:CxxC-x17-CxxC domain-containing protein
MLATDRPVPSSDRPRAQKLSGNGQRHQIECSECGQPAEVRFRPDPTRPVYCDSCFGNRPRRNRRPAAVSAPA